MVIALGATLSDRLSRVLELGVGLMLVVLGAALVFCADLLSALIRWRLRKLS